MRQTLSRGVFAAAAATGILSLYGSAALADTNATGVAEDSPGVLSGTSVQVPVKVPLNVCGNTVNALAALNDSFGNACGNVASAAPTASSSGTSSTGTSSGSTSGTSTGTSSTSGDTSGTRAVGVTEGSPGLLSGNNVQVPVDLGANVCGNSVDVGAVFNEANSNGCVNEEGYGTDEPAPVPSLPPVVSTPTPAPVPSTVPPSPVAPPKVETPAPVVEEPGTPPVLAETGSGPVMAASAAGAALLAGGVMLYRRGRATAQR
ncbi:chaplin [Streptomyces cadmiisoli]|uniref:chaplin n=1 Tax=Streptomyces cadmiisoli TaxID=2184053 RepID=UPI001FEAD5CB|nr:chaplin [Streptomyces cadmiisoli]